MTRPPGKTIPLSQPQTKSQVLKAMTTTVFLVRHAQTTFNVQKRIQGALGTSLTKKGKQQAKQMKRFFNNKKIDLVYSSPYLRAVQTAKIAFPNHVVHTKKNVRERDYGKLEGLKWSEFHQKYPRQAREYLHNRRIGLAGVETVASMRKRGKKTLEKIVSQHPGKNIAVFGHGMFNKALLAALLDWSDEFMATQHQESASINELEWNGKAWKLKNHVAKTKSLPTKQIEQAVKKWESKADFKSHDFHHVKRVAVGAKWFAKQLGMDDHKQEIAYIAGLVHDLGRPKTEKVDHTESSIRLATKMLEGFDLSKNDLMAIVELVGVHREGNASVEKQVVFLADKLWEQMGANVVFRRAIFCSEIVDYKDWDPIEAMIHQHRLRTKKFYPELFPKRFQKLAKYQYQWSLESLRATEKHQPWMLELIDHCRKEALKRRTTVDSIIKSFKPKFRQGKRFQKEANLYITGKKTTLFEKLVK